MLLAAGAGGHVDRAAQQHAPDTIRRPSNQRLAVASSGGLEHGNMLRFGAASPVPGPSSAGRRPGGGGTPVSQTLYERLGGKTAITAVIDDFVARCAADSRINGKFARTDIPRLKAELVDQVCAATGGPCTYSGRGMHTNHPRMSGTAGEVEARAAGRNTRARPKPGRSRESWRPQEKPLWPCVPAVSATASLPPPKREERLTEPPLSGDVPARARSARWQSR